jgi:hypothetical protein
MDLNYFKWIVICLLLYSKLEVKQDEIEWLRKLKLKSNKTLFYSSKVQDF